MKKVTGIGGIFFKCKDTKVMSEWYEKHLGFKVADDKSILFEWRSSGNPDKKCYTVWAPFKETTDYFQPSKKDYMINLRVEDLKGLLEELKKEGVQVIGEMETFDYGKFGWVIDPEGNKIELWEPVDDVFTEMYKGQTIY